MDYIRVPDPRTSLFGLTGWINGSLIAFLLPIPIVIIVAQDDKKSMPKIITTSIILGGFVMHKLYEILKNVINVLTNFRKTYYIISIGKN